MTAIQSATFAQSTAVSISKTTELNYERSASALSASASLGQQRGLSVNPFERLFDVVDISNEAQQKLLQDHQDALKLADIAQGRGGIGEFLRPQPVQSGLIQVDFNAIAATERFSFTETYELSFLQESTLSVETDNGSFEITQSRLVEVSLAATFEYERSASAVSLGARLTA